MRKILLFVLAGLLLAGYCLAATETCETYNITNTTDNMLTTYVSTSTIIPGIHKIVSISAFPTSGSPHGSLAAIYDAASATQVTEANLRGEAESVKDYPDYDIFPYPKSLRYGVAVIQGPRTIARIEYTR